MTRRKARQRVLRHEKRMKAERTVGRWKSAGRARPTMCLSTCAMIPDTATGRENVEGSLRDQAKRSRRASSGGPRPKPRSPGPGDQPRRRRTCSPTCRTTSRTARRLPGRPEARDGAGRKVASRQAPAPTEGEDREARRRAWRGERGSGGSWAIQCRRVRPMSSGRAARGPHPAGAGTCYDVGRGDPP